MVKNIAAFFVLFLINFVNAGETKTPLMVDPAIDREGPFCYLAKSTTSLSVPGGEKGTQVTFDGSLYTGGVELCFFYGEPLKPIMARQKTLLEGWLPIVQYSLNDGDIQYSFEAFAMSLEKDPLSNLITFVCVDIKNNGKKPAKARFAAATRFTGRDHRFEHMRPFAYSPDWWYEMTEDALFRDGKLVLVYPNVARRESVPGTPYSSPFKGREYSITDWSPVGVLRLEPELAPGQSQSFVFKIPAKPVPLIQESEIKSIQKANYAAMRRRTINYWKNLMNSGAQVSIPEKKVMDTHRSSLMYDWQAIWQKDGFWMQGVNRFQYRWFWLRDAAYIIRHYDVWGHHDIARKALEVYPKYQKSDGLFSSQGGELDGFGQALYALGSHAIITNDRAYAQQIYKHFPSSVSWLKKMRSQDPFQIMPYTEVLDNEYIKGHYTGHNFWALLGLRTAVRIAQMTGHTDDAQKFQKEYDDLLKAFMKKFEEVSGSDGYIPPGLDVEGGQDWGNLIGVFPTEVINPADPRLAATLQKMRLDKYKEGLMTYMGRLHHYLTVKSAQNFVFRSDQEEALRDFYAILLHTGSTNEMFEWMAEPWGDRDVNGNYPPHGWGAAMFNLLLRNMLLSERGGDGGLKPREIHLCSVLSPEWAQPGKEVSLLNAPTDHGSISFRLQFQKDGAVLDIKSRFRTQPQSIVFHIPYFVNLENFDADAPPIKKDNNIIVFKPTVRNVVFKWKMKHAELFSYERAVADYKKEYAQRFAQYTAAGNKPAPVDAPPLLSAEERKGEFESIYGEQKVGIAVGKPVTTSKPHEEGHTPDLAVDGNSFDKEASSWWSMPPAPVWLQVDLQEPTLIGAIHVFPYWDGSRYYQYTVEVSPDQKNWKIVADMSRNTKAATQSGDYYAIAPMEARFVRINMLYNSANTSLHLVELKVFRAEDKKPQ